MTPQQLADALLAHYEATFPAVMNAYDGVVPSTPSAPFAVLSLGTWNPASRNLGGEIRQRFGFRWMVVNNSPAGVRKNAAALADAFHGLQIGSSLVRFEFASDPIADDRIEGDMRWSVTLDFTYHP